jgi:hypothetical protein
MTCPAHPRAEIRNGELHFETADGWRDALASGVFYLRSPGDLDYAPGVRMCESYHLDRAGGDDDRFRGFRDAALDGSVLGYSSAGNDQVERVQLELRLWSRYLPAETVPMLRRLNELARAVVHGLFARCAVDPAHVAQITGGMDRDEALQYCIFNNYASRTVAPDGFTPHKDSGFTTLMYSTEPGLEACEHGAWRPVDPVPGFLTAITGHALEILTARMARPAAASYHRVRPMAPAPARKDRISFGVYIGPRFEQDLYQYDEAGRLTRFQSFMAFQRQKAAEMGYEFHPALASAAADA